MTPPSRPTAALTVLCWHNIDGTWAFPARAGAGVRGFERQLRVLANAATVVPLGTAVSALAAGERLPRRAVALTFDDGYADNLTLAVPALERMGLPATFFLVPGLLSGTTQAWWELLAWAFQCARPTRLDWEQQTLLLGEPRQRFEAYLATATRLKQCTLAAREQATAELVEALQPEGIPPGPEQFLDWSGARELVRRDFTVASHSAVHAILSQESPQAQLIDLTNSRSALVEKLGIEVDLLAYPNGGPNDYNEATLAGCRAAGYRGAFTTIAGRNTPSTPPFELRRVIVSPEWSVRDTLRNGWWTVQAARQFRIGPRRTA